MEIKKNMKFDVCVVSHPFPKHLMEKAGLLKYTSSNRVRIIIDYDPDSEEGFMNVFQKVTISEFQKVEYDR